MIKPEFVMIFQNVDQSLTATFQGNHKKATKLLLMAVQNRGQNGDQQQGCNSIYILGTSPISYGRAVTGKSCTLGAGQQLFQVAALIRCATRAVALVAHPIRAATWTQLGPRP